MVSENFSYLNHDIVFPLDIGKHIEDIYNLVHPVIPHYYQNALMQTTKTNVMIMINLLDLAKK